LQNKAVEYQEKYDALKNEFASYKENHEMVSDFVFDNGIIYNKASKNNPGPFCHACWEKSKKLYPVVPYRFKDVFQCTTCKNVYRTSKHDNE